ncbi:unnamed protein product [Calicophoron daubneyi]|uniref:DJ-1/PfpI domain-containing protein n=1 Tax=Calicophoron daubneyi TaxID=300641 RepID=A0AAV2SZP4_CALDB
MIANIFLLLLISGFSLGDKNVVVVAANGFEEIELVTCVDVLRRAGAKVTIASVGEESTTVIGSQNLTIVADRKLLSYEEVQDAIVLPGGWTGSLNMANSADLGALLKLYEKRDSYVAAICAAPMALNAHEVFRGKKLTSYPGIKKELQGNYTYSEEPVVVDGKLLTSRGPGTAFQFAFKLVELLFGNKKVSQLEKGMLFQQEN